MKAHPEYTKRSTRIRLVGYGAIAVGCIGFVLPFIPGFILFVVGFSLLSIHSPRARTVVAKIRARYPQFGHAFFVMESKVTDLFNLVTHVRREIAIPRESGGTLSAVLEDPVFPSCGLALVLHGATATKDTGVSDALAEAFRARGYTVLRFDAFDGLGDGGGTYTTFTTTKYLADLRTVMEWIRTTTSFKTVHLVGHSLGGLVALLYAEESPDSVAELTLYAPTISGTALESAYARQDQSMLTAWRESGVRTILHPLTNETYTLSYAFMHDIQEYDALQSVHRLTMPIELYMGTHDTLCSEADCAQFCIASGPHARMVTIPGLSHTPTTHEDLHRLVCSITGEVSENI